MEEKSIWRQKSGRVLAMGPKSGRVTALPPMEIEKEYNNDNIYQEGQHPLT